MLLIINKFRRPKSSIMAKKAVKSAIRAQQPDHSRSGRAAGRVATRSVPVRVTVPALLWAAS